jgi:chromosome segregation protein
VYFKKIDLTGFKSFAEKTSLYFEPGITAVVGPNGCGKSNIIDAIKWVLGEQSIKSLRGAKMEDVIFNGTDEKEPINMAEVSLTLSNKDNILPIDSNEVVVSRRLFRSGESEYLINKAPVRLKDVTELFMGTGIGAEMYSIIEQGKIGLILSSKPEERRFIFEEASGITKYKSKKREAARKLEATDNNLLRVSDIINEVKRQINSITRQANKAERYKQRFDRLKELEVKLASYEYDLLKKEKIQIETQSAKVRDESHSMSREIERLREKLENQKASLAEIGERFSSLQSGKFSKEAQVGQNRNKISVNKERTVELAKRVEDLKEEITSLEKRKESSQKLIQELEAHFQTISDSEDAKKDFLSEKEGSLEQLESGIKQNEKRIEENKQMVIDYMAERSKSRNEIVRLTSDIQNRSARLRRLNMELEKVAGESDAIKKNLDGIKKEFNAAESRLGNIRSEQDRLKKEKEKISLSLGSLGENLESERKTLITLESKKSFLEDLIARHEGFAKGVRALLESAKKGEFRANGIKGVLANAIKVKRGYEFAVEVSLGGYAQCVISQDRQSALEAAEYLNKNKLGRATFIILDEQVKAEEIDEKMLGLDGILGKLKDFVSADAGLENAMSNLLKNTYLVKSMAVAEDVFNAVPDEVSKDVKLLTKGGEIFRKGYITGGATSKGEDAGIIGRETRLKETIEKIDLSRNGINEMEGERDVLNSNLTDAEKKLNNIEDLLKEEELEYHKKENELASVEGANSKLEEELSLLKLERDEVTEEINDYTLRKNGLEGRLKELGTLEDKTQNILLNSQDSVKNFTKDREEVIVFIAQIKIEIQALSKEKNSLSQNLSLQKESYETYAKTLDQKMGEVDSSNKKRDELAQEIEELQREIEDLSEELKIASEELIQTGTSKGEHTAVTEDIERRLNELYKISNQRKDAEHNFEMKKSELGYKIETLRNRMSQLYKADMDTGSSEIDPSSDWGAIRREIDELNRKLESMGTVNLVAIEEHKELEERFNFLSHQRDDLTKAKDDLQKAIGKINKTTRKLFLETFEKIQFEFKNYFRYLFGGGQAEIFLLDEHDVLESGIEIVARPPGKKLQSITLLSGGEKALTAIALIFAVFKIKPSPFCFLDEVDAPLDESNIDRFSKALLEFTKKSQFIVVTHNKKTITLADVMYGITMEKSGISKIVSVKFHDEAKKKGVPQEEKKRKKKEEEEVLA